MSIEYGPAKKEHLPQMIELLGILFTHEAEFSPDADKQKRALEGIFADPSVGRLYVARDARRVVAMASLLFTISTAVGGRAALFEELVVRYEYRRQGR